MVLGLVRGQVGYNIYIVGLQLVILFLNPSFFGHIVFGLKEWKANNGI